MSEPLPNAVAQADQWEAEVMDVARGMAHTAVPADITLTEDETAFFEAGVGLGLAATLVVLERGGWLRKP